MFKLPLRSPGSREDWGERTHSGAWDWSMVWLHGEIRAQGQTVHLGEAMGARSFTAVGQYPWYLAQRPEVTVRAQPGLMAPSGLTQAQQRPKGRLYPPMGAVLQGLSVAGSSKASNEAYQQPLTLLASIEPRLGSVPTRSMELPNGSLRSLSKGSIQMSVIGDKLTAV